MGHVNTGWWEDGAGELGDGFGLVGVVEFVVFGDSFKS